MKPGNELPVVIDALPTRQRDFLLLNIFVLAQHGYIERAGVLADALHVLGDNSSEVTLARAVLRFFSQDWAAALGMQHVFNLEGGMQAWRTAGLPVES